MRLDEIYKKYPTKDDCLIFLEKLRWGDLKICPYCGKCYYTIIKKDTKRYHCNYCNLNFRVTVNMLFHNTKLDFQKWFLAIKLLVDSRRKISVRELMIRINVSKNTSWKIQIKIKNAILTDLPFLIKLIDNL